MPASSYRLLDDFDRNVYLIAEVSGDLAKAKSLDKLIGLIFELLRDAFNPHNIKVKNYYEDLKEIFWQ